MAVAEEEKKATRRKKADEPKMLMISSDELEKAIEKAADKIIKQTIKSKVDKVFREEWDKVTVANINDMARELIGKEFWEVIRIAKKMCHGDGVWEPTEIAITMQKLAGYSTTISTTSAILEGQYLEAYAENFVEAKKTSQTDGTAQQIATFACSEINTRRLLFRNLRDSLLEQINVLKKLHDSARDEKRYITPIQS